MTRFTKLSPKTHLPASGFNVTPLIPQKNKHSNLTIRSPPSACSADGHMAVHPKSGDDVHSTTVSSLVVSPSHHRKRGQDNNHLNGSDIHSKTKQVHGNSHTRDACCENNNNPIAVAAHGGNEKNNGDDPSVAPPEKKISKRNRSKSKAKLAKLEKKGNPQDNNNQGNPTQNIIENHSNDPSSSTHIEGDMHTHANKKQKRRPKKDAEARQMASQKRKDRRIKNRLSTKICFHCRQPGHTIKKCTQIIPAASSSSVKSTNNPEDQGTTQKGHTLNIALTVCYICGDPSHTTKSCHSRHSLKFDLTTGKPIYPFAICFICKENGHLSGQCDKNDKGVYPKGGCCKFCSSIYHLAKDCRPGAQEAGTTTLGTISLNQSADDDDVFIAIQNTAAVHNGNHSTHHDQQGVDPPIDAFLNGDCFNSGSSERLKKKKKVVRF